MLKLFLASHGRFASGIQSSINILTGSNGNLTVFDAYVDEKSLEVELNKFYETVAAEDQVILLSDMYGGSVNSIMYMFLSKPNTRLVTGVNLNLVLTLAYEEEVSDEALYTIISECRDGLRLVEQEQTQTEDTELF